MIRGVSRFTVEIKRPASPYFERAICFVKPEFAREDRLDLHRAAQEMIAQMDRDLEFEDDAEEKEPPTLIERLRTWLPLAISALGGAAFALLVCLLII